MKKKRELNVEKVRQKAYADSPFDLASEGDVIFCQGVDWALDLIEEELSS